MNKNIIQVVEGVVDNVSLEYKNALVQHQWSLVPDTQIFAAKQQLTKTESLMKIAAANPGAVRDAVISAGILGLDLTPGRRQGWLLPRKVGKKTQVVLQVGYKGVEAIHQRLGVIDTLSVRVVRKNDSYSWSGDDEEKPDHDAKPSWFATAEERGPIIGGFSVTYFPNKKIHVVLTSISEIYTKHRDTSDSWKSYQNKLANEEYAHPPPWVTFEEAMVLKTLAFIASKQWPANIRSTAVNDAVLTKLNEVETADYQELRRGYTDQQKEAFDKFLAQGNGLALYLFALYVGYDIFNDLFNSGEKGSKMALKEKCRRLEKIGGETLYEIREAFEADKPEDAFQHFEGEEAPVIELLARALPEHAQTIHDMAGK